MTFDIKIRLHVTHSTALKDKKNLLKAIGQNFFNDS